MSKILSIALLMALTIAFVTSSCVPADESKFYWKTPCDGQKYDNKIKVINVKISQNGKDIDVNGGFDLTTDLDMQVDIENNYGPIHKPLFDVDLKVYSGILFGHCKWLDVPTFGFSHNLDPCQFSQNCHLEKNETSIAVKINPSKVAGPLVKAVIKGDYYGASVTYKDDQTPLLCTYAQDIVIKK